MSLAVGGCATPPTEVQTACSMALFWDAHLVASLKDGQQGEISCKEYGASGVGGVAMGLVVHASLARRMRCAHSMQHGTVRECTSRCIPQGRAAGMRFPARSMGPARSGVAMGLELWCAFVYS